MFRILPIVHVGQKMAEKPNCKISKVLRYFFIIILLLSGFDFGFTEVFNRKFRSFVKGFSCLSGIITTTILIYAALSSVAAPYFMVTAWVWSMCIEFVLYFIVLRVTKYTFYNFLNDLSNINGISGSVESDIVAGVAIFYIFGMVISKLIYIVVSCETNYETVCDTFGIPYYVYHWLLLNIDVVALELILIYYYLYRSVKRLAELYNNSEINLESLQQRYMEVANCFDGITLHYDIVLFIELLINLPKLLGILWLTLVYIKNNVDWMLYVGEYVYVFHIMIQIFLPALVADRLNAQVEDLKLLLHKKLLERKDESPDVLKLLHYIEARSLRHKLCRVVPVDLRLPVSLLSLCTTYFIVIIQFTHLYD